MSALDFITIWVPLWLLGKKLGSRIRTDPAPSLQGFVLQDLLFLCYLSGFFLATKANLNVYGHKRLIFCPVGHVGVLEK